MGNCANEKCNDFSLPNEEEQERCGEKPEVSKSALSAGLCPLHEDILALLKKRVKVEHEYINPNFLSVISLALSDYYQCEDDLVDAWIQDMYGA